MAEAQTTTTETPKVATETPKATTETPKVAIETTTTTETPTTTTETPKVTNVAFSDLVKPTNPEKLAKIQARLQKESQQHDKLLELNRTVLKLEQLLADSKRKAELKKVQDKAHAEVVHAHQVVHKHEFDIAKEALKIKMVNERKQYLATALRQSLELYKRINASIFSNMSDVKHNLEHKEEQHDHQVEKMLQKELVADINREILLDEKREKAHEEVAHAEYVAHKHKSGEDDPEFQNALEQVLLYEKDLVSALREAFLIGEDTDSLINIINREDELKKSIEGYLDKQDTA